jgi:Dyp-type peroxidase family
MPNPVKVPRAEVQGIILRGYELLKAARFALLEIENVAAARPWLANIADRATSAAKKPGVDGADMLAINLAFTIAGLDKLLDLPTEMRNQFAPEFLEGMDTDNRGRVLGDTDNEELDKVEFDRQAPKHWLWGRRDQVQHMHLLLMVYAGDESLLKTPYDKLKSEWLQAGCKLIREFEPLYLPGRKEHFGFRDGIAQPAIEGVEIEKSAVQGAPIVASNMIKPGEILLGYQNAYGKLPPSPLVPDPRRNQPFDFGHNGSYLVFRQLQQDVPGFWQYIASAARREQQTPTEHLKACVLLASKMVGRWPGGAPISRFPDSEPAYTDPLLEDANAFFFDEDPLGLKTPIGAHIRRANPRDSLEPGPDGQARLSADESLRVTSLHRMIRRGRPYGPPLAESMQPGDILQAPPTDPDDPERGLLFLCFNTNIARQFELIQQTWVNNPKFGGLYRDSDPVMGQRHPGELNEPADIFTAQAKPVRQRYTGLKQFVRVRGGGYFFMPSIAALKFLGNIQSGSAQS